MTDLDDLIAQRRAKLQALRSQGNAFPNDFRPSHLAAALQAECHTQDGAALDANPRQVSLAGRMLAKRIMGKASFTQLQDRSGKIQIFLQQEALGDSYSAFKTWDLGDSVGVEGVLFRTKTGELSVRAAHIRLLTKALRPLPEKFHGLNDAETRYRQRYVDLIVNPEVRQTFITRTRLINALRAFLNARDFLEVETPMMQVLPGGATAKPFTTHHNAFDLPLYLRVAPELYLKRLVVGGLERVYEINRNFRNEGISTRHNPEFTMVEFYQAHADYHDLMDLVEILLRELALAVFGQLQFSYQGQTLDFAQPFARLSLKAAVLRTLPDVAPGVLDQLATARDLAATLGVPVPPGAGLGGVHLALFEHRVEAQLLQPTFITAYPTEVSPLARRNEHDPEITDRFELFVTGRELANGFSELNDADDQAERFRAQVQAKEAGDAEAMYYDADYIRALEYGLPPTAGCGIGIDRLTMLFTDAASIREVLLFPLLRPES